MRTVLRIKTSRSIFVREYDPIDGSVGQWHTVRKGGHVVYELVVRSLQSLCPIVPALRNKTCVWFGWGET